MKRIILVLAVVTVLMSGTAKADEGFMTLMTMMNTQETSEQIEKLRQQVGVLRQSIHWIPMSWAQDRSLDHIYVFKVTLLFSPELKAFMKVEWKGDSPVSIEVISDEKVVPVSTPDWRKFPTKYRTPTAEGKK